MQRSLSVSAVNAQSEITEEQANKIEKRFKNLDANKDGKISLDELISKDKKQQGEKFDEKKSKNKFKSMDADKDGLVTKDELRTWNDCFLQQEKIVKFKSPKTLPIRAFYLTVKKSFAILCVLD